MRSRAAVLALIVTSSIFGCDKKAAAPNTQRPPLAGTSAVAAAPLGDLSTSLAAVRTSFNAHKGGPRFLTLLSPT